MRIASMIPVGNDNPARRVAVVTLCLIAACVAVFVYELILPRAQTDILIGRWGLVPFRLWHLHAGGLRAWSQRGLLPVFTCMFLHGGIIHLLGNVWCLWIFGRELESRIGSRRFFVLYFVCGLAAGFLHACLNAHSALPTIGASGAIAGVMGAYFLLFPFNWIRFLVPVFFFPLVIKLPAAFFLLVWIATQLAGGYQTFANGAPVAGGIAFWAHVGGFFSGMFLIRRWKLRAKPKPKRKPARAR